MIPFVLCVSSPLGKGREQHTFVFFNSAPEDMFIGFRERGRRRGGEGERPHTHSCKEEIPVAFLTCLDWESNPQPSHVP